MSATTCFGTVIVRVNFDMRGGDSQPFIRSGIVRRDKQVGMVTGTRVIPRRQRQTEGSS